MFYTYILYNPVINQYYIGSTNNLDDRIYRHNSGQSKSTKKGAPHWILYYNENFETRSEAYQRELQIKKMKSRKYIENLKSGD
jgi:putative endonuclease